MQTEEFLARVLADTGLRVTVSFAGGKPKQRFHSDNGTAAAQLMDADARGQDAYHGCATYKDSSSRKAHNVAWVKALWVDLDVGPNKPYASQGAAARATAEFTKAVGLPLPLVVNSGYGLHVYWLLENAVELAPWQHAADLLKLAARHADFFADPSRTTDAASILRSPGTSNYKDENNVLSVILVRDGRPAPYDFIVQRLEQYLTSHDVDVLGAAPDHVKANNSDLEIKYDGPPPKVDPIIEACAIIREFRDSGGNVEEPLWRACMGVVRHCEGGVDLCHEWSSGYEGYTYAETQSKLEGLEGTGPTTCATLEPYRPAACAACPLNGVCKSPISAAYKALPVTEIPDPEDPEETIEIPELPEGYTWTTKGLYGVQYNKTTKENETAKMTDVLFYMIGRTKDKGDIQAYTIRVHERHDEVTTFSIPAGLVAEGGAKMLSKLGSHGIQTEGRGAMIQKYLQAWANMHRQRAMAVSAYDRFGWYGKDFLIGNTMYSNGQGQEVALVGSAENMAGSYTPKGDRDTWVALIDRAYNHQGLEPLQFALLSGLASPLLSMLKDYGGVVVYMHTQKSGIGKTTISRAALSCYGSWEETQLTYTQFTQNALFATFSAANAMPIVLDEMTAIEAQEATQLVHLISSGTAKRRCEKTGALQKTDHRWSLISLASGNNLLTEKITQDRSQAAAEFARVFEYSIHDLVTPIKREEAIRLFSQLADNYGWAGREFIEYVTANYDKVRNALLDTQAAVGPMFQINQSERYWGALLACVLTTHKIAVKLGLVQFPLKPMIKFIQTALEQNRSAMVGATPTADVQVGRMLGDLWPGMFVTHGAGDVHSQWDAYVAKHAQGKVTGRYIMRRPGAAGVNDKPVIFVTMAAFNDWCASKKVSARDLFKDAVAAGLIGAAQKTVYLGEGSVQYSGIGSHKCLVVRDTALPATMSPGTPHLTVVQGGLTTKQGP